MENTVPEAARCHNKLFLHDSCILRGPHVSPAPVCLPHTEQSTLNVAIRPHHHQQPWHTRGRPYTATAQHWLPAGWHCAHTSEIQRVRDVTWLHRLYCSFIDRNSFRCTLRLHCTLPQSLTLTVQRSLYVPQGLILTNSTFCPHSVFMCFVWIWQQTAIISLYSVNWLVFITETECVYCAVRTGSLYIILRSAHTVYLCVLCGSENKPRLFPYTALTDWFL